MPIDAVFKKIHIPLVDQAIILAAYGTLDGAQWQSELELMAMALQTNQAPVPPAPLCDPWKDMGLEIYTSGLDIKGAILKVTNALPPDLGMAIMGLLSATANRLGASYQGLKMGSKFSANRARRLGNPLMNPPDTKFQDQLDDILTPLKGVTPQVRIGNAESFLLTWLNQNGKFIRTPEAQYYYLWHAKHKLFELDTEPWHAWLHELTGINPASTVFAALSNACKSAAILNAEIKPVVRLAYYDNDSKVLWVSRFDGSVYCLGGDKIEMKDNGDGPVIFEDLSIWEPYEPDLVDTQDATDIISEIPNWSDGRYSWAYKVWTQSLFFNELCPTKPMMVLLGEKGSGKSMALRLLLRLLFGQWSQVSGVPVKPDDFSVTASHYHLYAMDNLDTLEPWLQDKLARISTGAMDEYRKLYTSKDMGILKYRCWIAVTARTPDTLRRDDLADRLLLLPLSRVDDEDRRRESLFLAEIDSLRGAWWGDLLTSLNGIVKQLQDTDLPATSALRMADWEALGRLMSIQADREDLWDEIVAELKSAQGNFLADGEIVIEAIDTWLTSISPTSMRQNTQRWVTARELYTESQQLLFAGNKPDSDWPRSVKAFGRRLLNIKSVLEARYGLKTQLSRTKTIEYWFDHK
ncbi:MAG: hypothetical protein VB108_01245 [Anaerolineaceae bacterium]|nr:hypothetical protein [Anaerolineaceae bacterium]